MNTFIIKETNKDDYNRFLIWLSFENIIDHLNSIEEAPNMVNSSGKILIDQLFITGNGYNRFICCNFKNGKLDFKTAYTVLPKDFFREETARWLHDNYQYVEYSILTEDQRKKVKNGIVF